MGKLEGEWSGFSGVTTTYNGGWDAYQKSVEKSQGFDVTPLGKRLCGGIGVMKIDCYVIEAAQVAVELYNETNNSNLVFESIVKANGQIVSGVMYYITLRARCPTDNLSKLYQAKVWRSTSNNLSKLVLKLFRERRHRYRKPGQTSREEKKPKHLLLPKGAFLTFMNDLRKHPDLHKMKHSEVSRLASMMWRSMSAEEKKRRCRTRSLESKDIAVYMKALCE